MLESIIIMIKKAAEHRGVEFKRGVWSVILNGRIFYDATSAEKYLESIPRKDIPQNATGRLRRVSLNDKFYFVRPGDGEKIKYPATERLKKIMDKERKLHRRVSVDYPWVKSIQWWPEMAKWGLLV